MSDKPMTQEELATIRTIMGKTTPGNWYAYDGRFSDYGIKSFDGGKDVFPVYNHSNQWNYGSDGIPRKEDAIFLAMSKEIVGRLLAEVERLRGEVARLDKDRHRRGQLVINLVSKMTHKTVESWWSANGEIFQTKKEAMQHVITQAEDEMKEAALKAVEDENG